MTRVPAAANTSSKTLVNLASRSRMRNLMASPRSPRSISRFLACWATQAPVGLAVAPMMWMVRVECSMKNRT